MRIGTGKSAASEAKTAASALGPPVDEPIRITSGQSGPYGGYTPGLASAPAPGRLDAPAGIPATAFTLRSSSRMRSLASAAVGFVT